MRWRAAAGMLPAGQVRDGEELAVLSRGGGRLKRLVLLLTITATALLLVAGTAVLAKTFACKGGGACYGTDSADTMYGNKYRNLMYGRGGPNLMRGESGNDYLNGDGGRDRLVAGRGDDTAAGGDGDDAINGGNGNDTINGGNGNDRIDARDGMWDLIDCGPGKKDVLIADSFDDRNRC